MIKTVTRVIDLQKNLCCVVLEEIGYPGHTRDLHKQSDAAIAKFILNSGNNQNLNLKAPRLIGSPPVCIWL